MSASDSSTVIATAISVASGAASVRAFSRRDRSTAQSAHSGRGRSSWMHWLIVVRWAGRLHPRSRGVGRGRINVQPAKSSSSPMPVFFTSQCLDDLQTPATAAVSAVDPADMRVLGACLAKADSVTPTASQGVDGTCSMQPGLSVVRSPCSNSYAHSPHMPSRSLSVPACSDHGCPQASQSPSAAHWQATSARWRFRSSQPFIRTGWHQVAARTSATAAVPAIESCPRGLPSHQYPI